MIETEIEAIFAGQDIGDGDVDVDGVLRAFERLRSLATKAELATLIAAMQSPRNNFWTRELFAELVSQLGGIECLEQLLEVKKLGGDDGHDNDGICTFLSEIAYADPDSCRTKLRKLMAQGDFRFQDEAEWLLGFCKISTAP